MWGARTRRAEAESPGFSWHRRLRTLVAFCACAAIHPRLIDARPRFEHTKDKAADPKIRRPPLVTGYQASFESSACASAFC